MAIAGRIFTTILVVSVLAISGCGTHAMDSDTQMNQLSSALQLREENHYETTSQMDNVGDIHANTEQYTEEMQGFMDRLIATCNDMMAAGKVTEEDGSELQRMLGTMNTRLVQHTLTVSNLVDLTALHNEMNEHHQAMEQMMGDIAVKTPHSGMSTPHMRYNE